MNRTSMKLAGVFFSIVYALLFVASIVLCAFAAAYTYLKSSIESFIKPYEAYINQIFKLIPENYFFYISAGLMVLMLILLIISVKYIKYSKASAEKYGNKKGLLVFNLIILLAATAGKLYLVYYYVNAKYLYYFLGAIGGLDGLNLLLILVALIKYKKPSEIITQQTSTATYETETAQVSRPVVSSSSSIYTAGLEESELGILDDRTNVVAEKKPSQNYETETTQKLVEGIGKLDQMRKEGSITTQEYTKLRNQMIRKFVK